MGGWVLKFGAALVRTVVAGEKRRILSVSLLS